MGIAQAGKAFRALAQRDEGTRARGERRPADTRFGHSFADAFANVCTDVSTGLQDAARRREAERSAHGPRSSLLPRSARGPRDARAGFTMLEVSLALTILVVALVATSASNMRLHRLQRVNRERNVAHNAAQSISETVQAIARDGVSDPAGWANHLTAALANGGQLGNRFDVPELVPVEGAPSVGTIQVITDETTTDASLGLQLGLPRDLNGDGDATDAAAGTGARLLPVVVRLRWRSQAGVQTLTHPFYVFGY